MNAKVALGVAAVVVLVGIGVAVSRSAKAPEPSPAERGVEQPGAGLKTVDQASQTPATTSAAKPDTKTTTASGKQSEGTFSTGDEVDSPDILVVEVAYDGTAFSPATVNIKTGDYVIFRNKSTSSFWPESVAGLFGAGKAVAAGGKYQYQFPVAGTFRYQDHVNTGATGTVVVGAR